MGFLHSTCRTVALATILVGLAATAAGALALSEQQERALKPKESFKECDTCPEMVVVPAGQFLMGARPGQSTGFDTPQHFVRIRTAFAVSRSEITVEQFAAFVQESGYKAVSKCWMLTDVHDGDADQRDGSSWRNPGFPQSATHPAVCVSWNDAKAYAAWLSRKTGKPYRLLSEAEWEYAARASTTTRYHFGDNERDLCRYTNGGDRTFQRSSRELGLPAGVSDLTCDDGHLHTAPVRSFPANAFGLYDMYGNVSEWVEDCSIMDRGLGYEGAPSDGSPWLAGRCTSRILRGGSWGSDSKELRSSARGEGHADAGRDVVGFRVARTLAR